MSTTMKWWLCEIDAKGKYTLEELDAAPELETGASITFQAPNREEADLKASKLAMRVYSRIKKKEAGKRLQANGQCRCGRKRDRPKPDAPGELMKICSTCAEMQKGYVKTSQEATVRKPRDEKARVEKNLARQRDRRKEIRLETLVEVNTKFWELPSIKDWEKWLEQAIEECKKP